MDRGNADKSSVKVPTMNKSSFCMKVLNLVMYLVAYIQTWLGCMFELYAYEDKTGQQEPTPVCMMFATENSDSLVDLVFWKHIMDHIIHISCSHF